MHINPTDEGAEGDWYLDYIIENNYGIVLDSDYISLTVNYSPCDSDPLVNWTADSNPPYDYSLVIGSSLTVPLDNVSDGTCAFSFSTVSIASGTNVGNQVVISTVQ